MAVKYFITGIAGFVGSELALSLAGLGHKVLGVDRAFPNAETAEEFSELGIEYVNLDLLNKAQLEPLLANVDVIIHAAGVSRVSEARARPMDCVSSTILATTNLVEIISNIAQGTGAKVPLLIYLSTREVSFYDRLEESQVSVDHIYAISKKAAEQLLLAFSNSFNIPLAICRLSDVYGGKRDHVNKLLPTFMKRAKQNKLVRVLDNETRFHFTHVQDVIISILEISELLQMPGYMQRCFELWSEESYTAEELAALVVSSFNSNSRIDYAVPSAVETTEQISFNCREWQFTPKFSLREEIGRLSENY
ncbi:NAD-dependent epimerase/dehydratase family protein [Methylomonas fluvii]|uniref:NAD(P)-dependent oxidoreductase n=1 Tax=Methylomonas fluvii TaxID=1854564 RepID=A0ABR9DIC0_9GAMM|nr:NAD(P)-dependent oxidoreductase [Methylomonas fluvii]MBD9362048.1 NAD(P)-dependent oxidoreductase [Methylomonas fluvii]